MTRKTWRDRLQHTAIGVVLTAAFPHLFHLLNWPSRVGPRGSIAHVAFNTLLLFAMRTWLFPLKHRAEERIRAAQELREQLGREPTEDEVFAHLGITCKR